MGRNFSLWNLLHNYHGEIDFDFARMMWRFGGEPPPYASMEEAVADYRKSQGKLWNGHICQPGNAMVGILQPDDGDEGLIHVSHGCAVRGVHAPTATGGIVVRLNPTHTFFELKLASSPEAVSAAAQHRARYDLWDASREFSKLGYTDPGFVPLEKMMNEAVTEWQKGWFYQDEAKDASGDEQVILWGKTIRCDTRCQCYARQVYNALVEPAKRPEDLGLREWLGSWGDWEVKDGEVVSGT